MRVEDISVVWHEVDKKSKWPDGTFVARFFGGLLVKVVHKERVGIHYIPNIDLDKWDLAVPSQPAFTPTPAPQIVQIPIPKAGT